MRKKAKRINQIREEQNITEEKIIQYKRRRAEQIKAKQKQSRAETIRANNIRVEKKIKSKYEKRRRSYKGGKQIL